MHYSTILSLVATLSAGSAVAVPATQYGANTPAGLPPLPADVGPGIHKFDFSKDGKMTVKRVADLDITKRSAEPEPDLSKRVNTWTGCESYAFTLAEQNDIQHAWDSLNNWASTGQGGVSPWVSGHYFAMTNSGVYAYLCEWGNGNHAYPAEVQQAEGVLNVACPNTAGIYQWNEWKKGLGIAAKGEKWCNGQGNGA
jgi:hypothetical protein